MDPDAEIKAFGFFRMLIQSNRMLERIMDAEFRQDGLTYKQWLVIAGINSIPGGPPSLGEVAGVIGTSHQNVRQLANQLEGKGFIDISRDPEDGRVLRLVTTAKNARHWASKDAGHARRVLGMFEGLEDGEVSSLHDLMERFSENVVREYQRVARP